MRRPMDLEQNELPICPAARVCEESLHFERDASPALAGRGRRPIPILLALAALLTALRR